MNIGRRAEYGGYHGSFLWPSLSPYRLTLPHSGTLSLFSFLRCILSHSQSFCDASSSQGLGSFSRCFSGSVCLHMRTETARKGLGGRTVGRGYAPHLERLVNPRQEACFI
jgi:hypothetical protein